MGVEQPPVSRLGDLLRLVVDLLGQAGDGTTILVGKKYLGDFGVGAPPRVLFVPNAKGRLAPAPKLNAGYIAGWTQGCKVYVRGAEDGTDLGYFESAEALAERVMNAVKECNPGRVALAPSDAEDDSPTGDNAYGADIVFEFLYTRPVARDVALLRPGMNAQATYDPDRPTGGNGKTYVPNLTAEAPTRP